jgi:ABC-2 type transport system permease protein
VMDLQCDFLPVIVGGDPNNPQREYLPWNYYPVFQSKDNHLINRNIGLVAGRFVNSVDTVEAEGVKKTILLSSSPNSRIISTPALISLNENKTVPEDDKFKTNNIPVAVLLEGNFTSLYRNRVGKAIMDSLQAGGVPFQENSGGAGKIIIAGDGDLVLNEMDRQEGRPIQMGWNGPAYEEYKSGSENARYFIPFANRNFFTNCLEYFTNKPGIVETGNKEIVLRLLDSTRVKEQRTTWQFINIGLPVLIIILAGFVYQTIRRSKYA